MSDSDDFVTIEALFFTGRKMPRTRLVNAGVLLYGTFKTADVVLGDDGKIISVTTDPGPTRLDESRVDLRGKLLIPGLMDIHMHGLEDKTAIHHDLSEIARIEPKYAVTAMFPGLAFKAGKPLLEVVERKRLEADRLGPGARCPGFFMEGPFVKHPGGMLPEYVIPVDMGYARELLITGGGKIKIMMVSPELEGVVELIEYLVSEGVVVALGHTDATVEQTIRAIDAGARLTTHTYNVVPKMPDVTEPGCWPVCTYDVMVSDPRMTCELISDGIHVHPIKAKVTILAKTPRRIAIVTDSNVGAGLPPGRYEFPGWSPIVIRPGDAARDANHGWLCGSAITMIEGVRRAVRLFGCTPAEGCTMASSSIADLLGLGYQMGKIAAGYNADLVVLDQDLNVNATYVAGKVVYNTK